MEGTADIQRSGADPRPGRRIVELSACEGRIVFMSVSARNQNVAIWQLGCRVTIMPGIQGTGGSPDSGLSNA